MIKKQIGFLILNKIFIKHTSKLLINSCILPKYYTTNTNNLDPKESLVSNVNPKESLVSDNQNDGNTLKLHKNLKNGKVESRQQKTVLNRKSSKSRKNNKILNKAIYACQTLLLPSLLTRIWVRRNSSSTPPDKTNEEVTSVKIEVDKFAENLFEILQCEKHQALHIKKLLNSLEDIGIRTTDPRLKNVMTLIEATSEHGTELSKQQFKNIIQKNYNILKKLFSSHLVIPEFKKFCKQIEDIYNICKENNDGNVAAYIPDLANVDPNYFGVTCCTIDGQIYSIGDVKIPFSIQSCSKPLTYAVSLAHLGPEIIHKYVGQEPSGRMFNELILDYNHKPHNPMINAGAIIVSSILMSLVHPEMSLSDKFTFFQDILKKMSGDLYIGYNENVYNSEKKTADRNYALGYYMREHRCYPNADTTLEEILDSYFKSCSVEANCESMAVICGTFANGGICPITEESVFKASVVRDVLTIMHSCGTYDYSGQFAFKVGLPAKSSVSGGLMLVIPNVMGMFIWSPKLDTYGNTVRGIQFCEELIKKFNFHNFDSLYSHKKKDPRKARFENKSMTYMKLLFSAAAGDITGLRRYKLSGLNMNASDYDGRTALHLAASEGHLQCVKFLCYIGGADPFKKDRWGHTPLDNAREFSFPVISEYLERFMKGGISAVKNDPKFKIEGQVKPPPPPPKNENKK